MLNAQTVGRQVGQDLESALSRLRVKLESVDWDRIGSRTQQAVDRAMERFYRKLSLKTGMQLGEGSNQRLILECKLIRTVEIGLHTQFIGEIMDVKAEDAVVDDKGLPDIEKVAPIIYGPEIRSYHGIGRYLGRAFEIGKKI